MKYLRSKIALIPLLLSACVKPYYHDFDYKNAKLITDAVEGLPHLAYANRANSVQAEIAKNHDIVQARCRMISNAMMAERDSIKHRNQVIGSIWAGITGALAFSNGLYNVIAKEQANSVVSALLGVGAGGASIPTYFFFGSDRREMDLSEKISAIVKGRENLNIIAGKQRDAVLEAQTPDVDLVALQCKKLRLEYALELVETDQCTAPERTRAEYREEQEKKAKTCQFILPLSNCADKVAERAKIKGTQPSISDAAKKKQTVEDLAELRIITKSIEDANNSNTKGAINNNQALGKINEAVFALETLCL